MNQREFEVFKKLYKKRDDHGEAWRNVIIPPTAPYDYSQHHESAPNNVVGNAVIPTCNAGHLLFIQPGIWKTYCISKDSQV